MSEATELPLASEADGGARKADNLHEKPSLVLVRDLTGAVAQLRHAYKQLNDGTVINQQEFASGLIAPQIERIEKVIRRLS